MRHLLTIILILLAADMFCQSIDQIGQLKLVDCKVTKTENVSHTISGQAIKMVRLTIIAQTKIQMSCNYGDPSKNKYETINNKVSVSYAVDSTGLVRDSIFREIKQYVEEQEAWAKKYNTDSDFSLLPFDKSFFLKDTIAIPFIKTMGENPGSYQLFYIDGQVYKIELLERNGLGCLSSFVQQNIHFLKDNKRLELGDYIKNIDQVKSILTVKN